MRALGPGDRRKLVLGDVGDKIILCDNGQAFSSNSGVGLDAEKLQHIFEAFHTTKSEGMGMGLTISRSIIEAHGGRLWATPNKPRGATFQLTLPAVQGNAS